MGTILPFQRPSTDQKNAQRAFAKRAVNLSDMLLVDALFYTESEENRKRVQEAQGRGNAMTMYVLDLLHGFQLKGENLEMRRQTLKETTLEDLCGYLLNSDQTQWSLQPHYYGAVFVEFDAHKTAVEEYVSKLNDKKP